MSDLDNKLIFEAYSNNLLLEQLLNAKEMLSDIEDLFKSDEASLFLTIMGVPEEFKGALGKLAAKSILQWLNSEPAQDYYDDNFDVLSNTQLFELEGRFSNIGKTLNDFKREGVWAWDDDEEKKKKFEQKYGMKHPRNLPDWMYEDGTTKLREDLYKWNSYKLMKGHQRQELSDNIISLYSSLLSMKYSNDEHNDYISHVMDFIHDHRLNKQNADLSGIRYAHSKEGIFDYFLKQPVEHRLMSIYNDYNKFLKALEENKDFEGAKQIYDDPKKARLIKDYGNGWKWVQLLDKDACQISGDLMDHCVGGYDPLNPYQRILQLVGPDGDGHATIQLTVNRVQNYNVNVVSQIKGKKNSKLKPEYEQMVKDLLTSYKVKPLTTKLKDRNGNIIDFSGPVKQPTSYSYK